MTPEIGSLPPLHPAGANRRVSPPAGEGFSLELARAQAPARADSAVLSLPASPPPEVLDAIGAAADRAAELRAANRELHFSTDRDSGRVIVQVRDLAGNVIRTIPPSHALDVMAGASV